MLVGIVSAKSGTIGAEVLEQIRSVAAEKGCPLECKLDVEKEGMILLEKPGSKRYHTNFVPAGPGCYRLEIGAQMPKERVRHLASMLVAMIIRDETPPPRAPRKRRRRTRSLRMSTAWDYRC